MKRITGLLFTIVVCGLFVASCHSGRDDEGVGRDSGAASKPISQAVTGFQEQYPVFSVAETAYDFDTIYAGDVVEHDFRFKNTGSKPLIIKNVSSTCGCTVPSFPKEPVKPGAESILKVVFNSAGKSGNQVKPIFVTANTMPDHFQLKITAEVLPKKP